MPPDTMLGYLLQGGAVGVLALMVWWSRDGTIRWGKQVDIQIAALNAQMEQARKDQLEERERADRRNDELWELLKESTGAVRENAHAVRRAATVAESATALAESALHGREAGK